MPDVQILEDLPLEVIFETNGKDSVENNFDQAIDTPEHQMQDEHILADSSLEINSDQNVEYQNSDQQFSEGLNLENTVNLEGVTDITQ